MRKLLKKEFPVILASQPRIRRAWLSYEKPLFLAQISESGDGFVTAVQHAERFDLPQLGKVNAFAFRPISETQTFYELAAAGNTGVQRFDLEAGIQLVDCQLNAATAVSYSSCGRRLAAGNAKGIVKVFDLTQESPEEIYCHSAAHSAIGALAFSATGDMLFVLTRLGELLAIDMSAIEARRAAQAEQASADRSDGSADMHDGSAESADEGSGEMSSRQPLPNRSHRRPCVTCSNMVKI